MEILQPYSETPILHLPITAEVSLKRVIIAPISGPDLINFKHVSITARIDKENATITRLDKKLLTTSPAWDRHTSLTRQRDSHSKSLARLEFQHDVLEKYRSLHDYNSFTFEQRFPDADLNRPGPIDPIIPSPLPSLNGNLSEVAQDRIRSQVRDWASALLTVVTSVYNPQPITDAHLLNIELPRDPIVVDLSAPQEIELQQLSPQHIHELPGITADQLSENERTALTERIPHEGDGFQPILSPVTFDQNGAYVPEILVENGTALHAEISKYILWIQAFYEQVGGQVSIELSVLYLNGEIDKVIVLAAPANEFTYGSVRFRPGDRFSVNSANLVREDFHFYSGWDLAEEMNEPLSLSIIRLNQRYIDQMRRDFPLYESLFADLNPGDTIIAVQDAQGSTVQMFTQDTAVTLLGDRTFLVGEANVRRTPTATPPVDQDNRVGPLSSRTVRRVTPEEFVGLDLDAQLYTMVRTNFSEELTSDQIRITSDAVFVTVNDHEWNISWLLNEDGSLQMVFVATDAQGLSEDTRSVRGPRIVDENALSDSELLLSARRLTDRQGEVSLSRVVIENTYPVSENALSYDIFPIVAGEVTSSEISIYNYQTQQNEMITINSIPILLQTQNGQFERTLVRCMYRLGSTVFSQGVIPSAGNGQFRVIDSSVLADSLHIGDQIRLSLTVIDETNIDDFVTENLALYPFNDDNGQTWRNISTLIALSENGAELAPMQTTRSSIRNIPDILGVASEIGYQR